uniref:Protein krueppel n=1 Tax=Anopheles christyi TaxID=43041 RepID=A0A182JWH2_9DIPT
MEDLSTVCRLCFNCTLLNVQDDHIYQKISVCLGLLINPVDKSWPYRVCSGCVEKVEEFHRYRESCWDVQNMLLNVLHQVQLADANEDTVNAETVESIGDLSLKGDYSLKDVMHEKETVNVVSSNDELSDDTSKAAMQRKRKKAHSTVVICDICGKTLLPTFYQGHLNEHSNVKPFACESSSCGKTFFCRHALRRHSYYRHSGQMYSCQECGTAYKSKMELSTHRLHVHTRGKAFACEHCGKSFVTRSYLKTHLKTHTDEPMEKCSYCPKLLYSKKGLKYHELLHTNEKPY